MQILVSACLIGNCCRYDGKHNENRQVMALEQDHVLVPVCPEELGGLLTPRLPCEIENGRVISANGDDVTHQFVTGANKTLGIALKNNCQYAILKERSPSCGMGEIYDGTFSGTLRQGNGVTASLLIQQGICVMGESDITQIEK